MAASLLSSPHRAKSPRPGKAGPDRLAARLGGLLIGLGCLGAALTGAQAQQVYRIVGPDGRVTFSDRPPEKSTAAPSTVRGASAAEANDALPPELRKTASQYPVTLYVTGDCSACDTARQLLIGRGIPFAEKTVNTAADNTAFKQATGGDSLPALSIGSQILKGLQDRQWNSYLDAAGYPAQTQLPASYRRPPPTPLAPPAPAAPAREAAPAAKPAPLTPVIPKRATDSNPAGLQF